MAKNLKLKKSSIVILISLLMLVVFILLVFIIGNSLLSFEVAGGNDTIEVGYLDTNYVIPEVKCNFLGLSADITKKSENVDVTKLGEGEVKYSCKKLIFSKTKTFKVKIVDKEAPKITLNGSSTTYVYIGKTYNEKNATALDNIDGDLTDKIKIEGSVDSTKKGEYQIKYTVSDNSGNVGEMVRKVIVKDPPSNSSCGEKGVIYLTFDDGPSAETTPKILDVLKKYNVKATFFVTNAGPDELIKREFDEGHVVALHSSSHDYAKIYKSSDAFWSDMEAVQNRVFRITGEKAMLFRFPGGSSNTVSRHYSSGIMSLLSKEADEKGYTYFDWNESSGDAGELKSPTFDEKVKEEIKLSINSFSKSHGNVILMHDIKQTTANAIEEIVKYGIDNGYTFDVLDDSIICHQKINN